MKIQNLWNGYAVAWLRLLVTRRNNGSGGKTNEGGDYYYSSAKFYESGVDEFGFLKHMGDVL